MYKFAAQNKLRFGSVRGELTVEQLFDLPLKHESGFDLNTIACGIHTRLKSWETESFVEDHSESREKKLAETAMAIVKDIIKTKQDERAARLSKIEKAQERKKILDVIAAKKEQQLTQASLEELEKKLSELD